MLCWRIEGAAGCVVGRCGRLRIGLRFAHCNLWCPLSFVPWSSLTCGLSLRSVLKDGNTQGMAEKFDKNLLRNLAMYISRCKNSTMASYLTPVSSSYVTTIFAQPAPAPTPGTSVLASMRQMRRSAVATHPTSLHRWQTDKRTIRLGDTDAESRGKGDRDASRDGIGPHRVGARARLGDDETRGRRRRAQRGPTIAPR